MVSFVRCYFKKRHRCSAVDHLGKQKKARIVASICHAGHGWIPYSNLPIPTKVIILHIESFLLLCFVINMYEQSSFSCL